MTEELVNPIAQAKLAEVSTLVANLAGAEQQIERGYGKLAFLLKEVSEHRYWEGAFKSFGEYLKDLGQTFKLGRSQFYNYLSAARDLSGDLTEDQLNTMGISKALVLRDAKEINPVLPANAIEHALDPSVTVKDLKKMLFEAKSLPQAEDGSWMDLDLSCMASDNERLIINSAFNAARHGDPTIDETKAESTQKKEALLKICMEYASTHSGDIVEGGRGVN